MMKQLVILLVSICLNFMGSVLPQQGESFIQGKVTDKKTGESLSFANLRLLQNGIPKAQGQADVDGHYKIGPVAPGVYSLQVKYLGYKDTSVEAIELHDDKTKTFDIRLGNDEVKITHCHSEFKLFDSSDPSTTTKYYSNELRHMPFH